MRKIALHILLLMTAVCHAQTENGNVVNVEAGNLNAEIETVQGISPEEADKSVIKPAAPEQKEIEMEDETLFRVWDRRFLFTSWRPWMPFHPGGMWNLHEGLNAEVTAGVMVGLGKNNPFHGASFFSDISLMYAKPINDRWSFAIGGDISKYRIWNSDVFSTRLEALANYKINEHFDATLYGTQHIPSLSSDRQAFGPMFDKSTTIGAALTWKPTSNTSFGISIEHTIVDDPKMPHPPIMNNMHQQNNNQGRRP